MHKNLYQIVLWYYEALESTDWFNDDTIMDRWAEGCEHTLEISLAPEATGSEVWNLLIYISIFLKKNHK